MPPTEPNTQTISFDDQTLLEKCREVELLNCKLYTCFAETYTETPEAVHLWRKTASEEQNHAEQFKLALKLKKGLSLHAGVSMEKANDLIKRLELVINKASKKSISVVEALDFSIKLEHYLADFHLACVAEFQDASFEKLFKAMMASDQHHISSIELLKEKLSATAITR